MSFTDEIYTLVVDDEENHAELTADHLEVMSEYMSADYVTSGEEALEYLDSDSSVNAVIADYSMPGMDGIELLEEIDSEYDIPVIMFTGRGSEETAIEALRAGAEDYVKKGGMKSLEKLHCRAENAAFKNKAERELGVLKAGVDNAGHAIQVTDPEANIIYVNEALEELTGYSEDDLRGEDPSVFSSDEHDEEFYEEMWRQIENGEIWAGEILNEDRHGEEYWINQTISPITDENGQIQYLIGVATEITEKKELQERRELLNSMLRHDVGNDLQTITGYIDILRNTDLTEEQQEYVDTIHECISESNELLHGVRGLLQNDPADATEEVDVAEIVDEVLERKESLADSKDIEVEVDMDEDYTVEAGPLLDQALSNLVENAIIHPDNVDSITIGTEEEDEGLAIYVADDGEGLPEEFSFEKGEKGEDSSGTGMGTWLTKEIAEAYGEGVEARESEEGGAKFVMRLEEANQGW